MSNENKTGVDISVSNGIQIIKFNNPKTKNALKSAAYVKIREAFEESATNEEIKCTVLTGTGEYYSSGFDITEETSNDSGSSEDVQRIRIGNLRDMITAFIDYPKLLIAVVNGPAIGIAVTTLGLCDIVYASERASFCTPFARLGLCAEGCSSYTFPLIMGISKASEMLYTAYKMTANEAYKFNLVSEVVPHEQLPKIWNKIHSFTKLSVGSIMRSKELARKPILQKLHEANRNELKMLEKCFVSEDFYTAIIAFMSKSRNKL